MTSIHTPISERIVTRQHEFRTRYHYIVLQRGSLPLSPDNSRDFSIEHQCSSVLIWPHNERPSVENTIVTDPCFTANGYKEAEKKCATYGMTLDDLGYLFLTHLHGDHRPNVFCKKRFKRFRAGITAALQDVEILDCPGHSPKSKALLFRSVLDTLVCIAGDTILDAHWLKAWKYYWPNCYLPEDIVETWESVANILAAADTIVPGHGGEIHVTASLLENLLSDFPIADYAEECPQVPHILRKRLKQLQRREA